MAGEKEHLARGDEMRVEIEVLRSLRLDLHWGERFSLLQSSTSLLFEPRFPSLTGVTWEVGEDARGLRNDVIEGVLGVFGLVLRILSYINNFSEMSTTE